MPLFEIYKVKNKMKLEKPSFVEEIGFAGETDRVLFCVHGLNQRPEALKPLLKELRELGFKPYLMRMPGHDGGLDFGGLSPESFHKAYEEAYHFISQKHQTVPYFLGYSFGGLLGVCNYNKLPLKKMVLLAPAIQLHTYTFLLQPALPFLNKVSSISLGNDEYEKRYRYHEHGVPKEIYQCFFSIYKENLGNSKKSLQDSEALVLAHPYDELVSYKKLKKWVRKNTGWRTQSINNEDAEYSRYNHLCFDQTTLGKQSYSQLVLEVNEFLTKTN